MNPKKIKNIFDSFKEKKVLIIGDSMIDDYMWGNINRMSPEAPVPVIDIEKYEMRLGGAANCALNIKSLGAKPILCSVIGNDDKGKKFNSLLKESKLSNEAIISSNYRKTTIKTRVIAEGRHQIRIDNEDKQPINKKIEEKIIEITNNLLKQIDVIILQDYNKGVLTKRIISKIINNSKNNNIPVIVDPKKDNFLEYKNCDIFKPNLTEIKEGMGVIFNEKNQNELIDNTSKLRNLISAKSVLLTLSSLGLCINSNTGFIYSPTYGGKVVDVSGAGDTVISIASLLYSSKVNFNDIAKISSIAGGIVCQKVGVVPINFNNLLTETLKLY